MDTIEIFAYDPGRDGLMRTVAVAFLLAAWPILASANSAWVLWQSTSYPSASKYAGRRWDITASFPSFDGCSKALDRTARFDPLAVPPSGQEFTWRVNESKVMVNLRSNNEPGIWYTLELICLPETIDPRR